MNTILNISIIFIFLLCIAVTVQGEQNNGIERIIIGMDSMSSKPLVAISVMNHNGLVVNEIPAINAIVVEIPKEKYVLLKLDSDFKEHVLYMEPDIQVNVPIVHITEVPMAGPLTNPNDPYYPYQWGLPMIEVNYAWDIITGNKSTIVAVVDTGVDYNHNDLGAVDDSIGWDFANSDNDSMDDNGHGTHVAGIIAATINNNEGVVGVAPGITIMPVKVLNAQGTGWTSDIASGIAYAADNGAQIISLSLGSWFPSKTLKDATRYAVFDKGCIVILEA